jgi:hypothetical protein
LVEARLQAQALANNGHQHVDRDRDPDLGLYRVLAGTEEGLDPQVLLDPLEKQFRVCHQLHRNQAVSPNVFA